MKKEVNLHLKKENKLDQLVYHHNEFNPTDEGFDINETYESI